MFTGRIAELHHRMAWTLREAPAPYRSRLAHFASRDDLDAHFRALLLNLIGHGTEEADVVCEKTPSNVFHAQELLELFPESHFLHILRDGRDVLASHRRVARRARGTLDRRQFGAARVCKRWNRAVAQHFELEDRDELRERYVPLRFEELVTDPTTALGAVCAQLDLELEPQMLDPGAGDDGSVVEDDIWQPRGSASAPLDPRRAGAWRRELGPWLRVYAGLQMASNLRRLGY